MCESISEKDMNFLFENFSEIGLKPPACEGPPVYWWDSDADKSNDGGRGKGKGGNGSSVFIPTTLKADQWHGNYVNGSVDALFKIKEGDLL